MIPAGFVSFAEAIAGGGYYYWTGSGRCDPLRSGYADCSGLICSALRHVGVDVGCTGSFQLARWCHDAGKQIDMATARATRGALVFMGVNQGRGGRPGIDPGHVAISRGDGTVVEARNRRAGILISGFDGRGWTGAYLPAWFDTHVDPTPVPEPAPAPIEEDLLTTIASPFRRGRQGTARPVKALGGVLLEGGASLHDDHSSGKARFWQPSDHTVKATGYKLIDITHTVYPEGDKRAGQPDGKGIVALYDLGNHDTGTYKALWS